MNGIFRAFDYLLFGVTLVRRATRAFDLRFLLLAFPGIRLLVCGVSHVAHERPEVLRDGLVAVAGGVLEVEIG